MKKPKLMRNNCHYLHGRSKMVKKKLTKRELDVNIWIGVMVLFVLMSFYVTMLKAGIEFMFYPPVVEFSPKELTKMVFMLLGVDFMIVALFLAYPISQRLTLLLRFLDKRFKLGLKRRFRL